MFAGTSTQRNATKCYVYLSDVTASPPKAEKESSVLLRDLGSEQASEFKANRKVTRVYPCD
jgi:hypothetical protein